MGELRSIEAAVLLTLRFQDLNLCTISGERNSRDGFPHLFFSGPCVLVSLVEIGAVRLWSKLGA